MTKKKPELQLSMWIEWAFKVAINGIASLAIYFTAQLSSTVKDIQAHQVETDKRVTAIESSRETNMPRYLSLETEFQNVRVAIEGIKVRLDQMDKLPEKRPQGR